MSACAEAIGLADTAQIPSLEQLIRANAQRSPDAACIVSVTGDALTWRQVVDQLARTHASLRAFGFGPHDRIALALPNGPTAAVAFLSVAACTACAPLNSSYTADEFAFYLDDLGARALIAAGDASGPAMEAAARLGIPVIECESDNVLPGRFDLKCHLRGDTSSADVVTTDSVALLLHTSGTTSRPKLVPLRHSNLIASVRNMVRVLQLSAADRCLNLMPLFHIHGLVGGLLAPLAAGGSAVCPPNLRPGDFFRWLNDTRPTWYTAVPTIHRAIVADAVGQQDVIERCPLRFIRSSSAPLPTRIFNELGEIFRAPVLEAYSMTEAAHQMTCNPLAAGQQRSGTVGLPAGPEVALLDRLGRVVSPGETGEIAIRGPSVMGGYEGNPEANADAFINGWFRTGDQGRFDRDGYLVLTGRLKEQINRGGEKISPLELDQILLRHPDVAEAAAFGFPHPSLGEEIAAAVVLRPQCNVTAAQLRAFMREHLAPFKLPRRILILDQMPKGPTGKVQRRQLGTILRLDVADPHHADDETQIGSLELQLLELWRTMLDCNSIGLDDDFFEKGGDSLLAFQMLLELESLVGHGVPESILVDHPTIRRLAQGVAELDLSSAPRELVHVQAQGERPPFFFFHGDYTGGYYTRRLARLLGADQPFISVTPHGLGAEAIPDSIEQMAAARVPLLVAAQPQGPFRIGRYCKGAVEALEVARLLSETGRHVELVALIDSPMLNLRPTVRTIHRSVVRMLRVFGDDWEQRYPRLPLAMDLLWRQLSNFEQISLARYWDNFRHGLTRALSERLGTGGASADRLDIRSHTAKLLAARERRFDKIYNRLFRRYFPQPIEVPVIYFSAEYRGSALRNLGARTEVVTLPGGHWGCITTHVEVLAEHLRRRLNELSAPARLSDTRMCSEP